jgi:hypothetical protein
MKIKKYVFPSDYIQVLGQKVESPGLTQREFYSVIILQGLIANPDIKESVFELVGTSVNLADALITQLER